MAIPRVPGFRRGAATSSKELLFATTAAACHPEPGTRVSQLVERAADSVIRDLPALAAAHRVDGCVHAVLEQTGGAAAEVLQRLAAARRQAATHHLLVRDVLARVAPVLDGAGIPWLVFKGPVLSSSVYCDPGMRRYSDLDVLVPPERFADAVAAMERAGFENPITSWAPQAYFRAGAIAFDVGGISVDLHWHVVYKYQDRRWHHIDPEQLFARRRTIEVGGRVCSTFDDVDTVFHLALHAAREGCEHLVWLKDIELAIATGQPDLDELVRRSREARCAPAIGIALARSKWALGTDVPDDIVAALVGRVWPRIVRAVASFDDVGSTRRRSSPGAWITRQTRMSLPRTAIWAARRVSDHHAERRVDRVLRHGFDPHTCTPAELARNEADRVTFFAFVRDWRSELTTNSG
ncbi:MAG TPA: nucleotidyltransferase family protein [Ilumatobacteraceae bacterium]|nr:nucleotidyltransferase family protein [Ilumatobacteraceae bacterium]